MWYPEPDEELEALPSFGETILHWVAHHLVHHALIVWLSCLTLMTIATGTQLAMGRFSFGSSSTYDLFVAQDDVD